MFIDLASVAHAKQNHMPTSHPLLPEADAACSRKVEMSSTVLTSPCRYSRRAQRMELRYVRSPSSEQVFIRSWNSSKPVMIARTWPRRGKMKRTCYSHTASKISRSRVRASVVERTRILGFCISDIPSPLAHQQVEAALL